MLTADKGHEFKTAQNILGNEAVCLVVGRGGDYLISLTLEQIGDGKVLLDLIRAHWDVEP